MHVFIFTYKSPFSEVPEFVEEEIKYWPSNTKVILISLANTEKKEIIRLFNLANVDAFAVSPISLLLIVRIVMRSLNKRFFRELFNSLFHRPIKMVGKRLKLLLTYEFVTHRYYLGFNEVKKNYNIANDKVILYSYWLGPATISAIDIQRKYKQFMNLSVISRAHGSDLYAYANETNWLPFLNYSLKNCDSIFPISQHGINYITQTYHITGKKASLSRLGINNHNSIGKVPEKGKVFHIISCSYLNANKRVNLIAEAISLIDDKQIKWTHLGGGPLEDDLRSLCHKKLDSKNNIEYNITGNLSNTDIIKFYECNNINLLINVSLSEGIPVSMMEANSFGVPILAGSIGGIEELLINDFNGIILERDYSITDLKNSIEKIIILDTENYMNLCYNSLTQYNDFFNADKNYCKFVSTIIEGNI